MRGFFRIVHRLWYLVSWTLLVNNLNYTFKVSTWYNLSTQLSFSSTLLYTLYIWRSTCMEILEMIVWLFVICKVKIVSSTQMSSVISLLTSMQEEDILEHINFVVIYIYTYIHIAQANTHTQRHMRWSPPHLALLFIAIFVFGSYIAYGISQLPLPTKHIGLFNPYSIIFLWLRAT